MVSPNKALLLLNLWRNTNTIFKMFRSSSYICHYDPQPELDTPLNCSRLTLMVIRQAWAATHLTEDDSAEDGAAKDDAAADDAAEDDDAEDDDAAEDDAAEDDAAEDDAAEDDDIPKGGNYDKCWAAVTQLQWALASDRHICNTTVVANIASLRGRGEFDGVRHAIRTLMVAMAAKYPFLTQVDRPTLVQLLALGEGMTATVGDSPEFLEFVKKELQSVNLAALLGV